MITGQGTTFIQPNAATPNGAPFVAGSADNGLSVDLITGRIVLGDPIAAGGMPGGFLSNRFLNLEGFAFEINDAAGSAPYFIITPGNQAVFGDVNGIIAGGNGSLNFNFPTRTTVLTTDPTGSFAAVLLDGTNSISKVGDNGGGNNNKLFIDDAGQRWSVGQDIPITNLLLNFPGAGIGLSFFDSNGNNPFLLPDPGIGGIAFISAPDFSTQLALSDGGSASLATLGDVGGLTTGMAATVDVPNSLFSIADNANNAVVRINGVNGFTGIVAPPLTITVDGGIVTNVA